MLADRTGTYGQKGDPMRFREEAIRGNVNIALMHVMYDLADQNWFDAAWVSARLNELGHHLAESSVEHILEEKASDGELEREGGYFRPYEF